MSVTLNHVYCHACVLSGPTHVMSANRMCCLSLEQPQPNSSVTWRGLALFWAALCGDMGKTRRTYTCIVPGVTSEYVGHNILGVRRGEAAWYAGLDGISLSRWYVLYFMLAHISWSYQCPVVRGFRTYCMSLTHWLPVCYYVVGVTTL